MTSRKSRQPSSLMRFWLEWRVELLILAAIVLAIFLLVENFEIRKTIFSWLAATAKAMDVAVSALARRIISTTLSDLVAVVLIFGALLVARWRVRWRLLNNQSRLAANGCP